MTRIRSSVLISLAGALVLAGCGSSPPVRYFTLGGGEAGPAGGAGVLVEVLPPVLPERLNRDAVVIGGAGAGALSLREGDQWAAPLSDEWRGLLDAALWRGSRAADVYAAPVPEGAADLPQYRLALKVDRFEAAADGRVTVEAGWTLRRLPRGRAAVCRVQAAGTAADASTEAVVRALGAAARRVADAAAGSLARLEAGAPDPCTR